MAWNSLDGIALFIQRETFGSQGYSLIELYMISDNTGCSDHDTGTMVNGKMMTDLCSRMDVNAGF